MIKTGMKKIAMLSLLGGVVSLFGCARPGEFGYSMTYTTEERWQMALRNWDLEGKMTQDDLDSALLIRPVSQLSWWRVH